VTDAAQPAPEVPDAQWMHDAVLGCPDVAAVYGGAFGEIASYLPGRAAVPGVRIDDDVVEVHVIARYGSPLAQVGEQIGAALTSRLHDRQLRVSVEDIVLPGEAVPEPQPAGEPAPS
jgi:hypothetical protein